MPRLSLLDMPSHSLCTIPKRYGCFGGIALAMIATLLVVAATTLAIRMARQVQDKTAKQQLTQQRMERIAKSLEAYWVVHGCKPPDGALGSSKTGDEVAGGTTVPWRALGIEQSEALDGWGRKISYKKSGVVQIFGGSSTESFDWALISHGPTGYGAWFVSEPTDKQMPAPTNPDEVVNANPGLNYLLKTIQEKTGSDVLLADLFDDFLSWGSFDELLCNINKLTTARLDSITPVAYTGRNANTTSITFDSATAWGDMTVAPTGGTISRNAGGTGIGVCSGACATDAESALDNSKSLGFKLSGGKTAGKFALGVLSLDPTVQISFTFKLLGANVGVPVVYPALPSPPAAIVPYELTVVPNLMPSTATPFDEVVVQPLGTSRFFIASIRFCTAAENCN